MLFSRSPDTAYSFPLHSSLAYHRCYRVPHTTDAHLALAFFLFFSPVPQIRRILRPGGHVVVLETLGTAVEAPQRNSYFYRMMEEMGLYVDRVISAEV